VAALDRNGRRGGDYGVSDYLEWVLVILLPTALGYGIVGGVRAARWAAERRSAARYYSQPTVEPIERLAARSAPAPCGAGVGGDQRRPAGQAVGACGRSAAPTSTRSRRRANAWRRAPAAGGRGRPGRDSPGGSGLTGARPRRPLTPCRRPRQPPAPYALVVVRVLAVSDVVEDALWADAKTARGGAVDTGVRRPSF